MFFWSLRCTTTILFHYNLIFNLSFVAGTNLITPVLCMNKHSIFLCRELYSQMNTTKTKADSGDSTQQLDCFGIGNKCHLLLQQNNFIDVKIFLTDFPGTCPTYNGPHSVECLKSVWSSVGCLAEGEKYPDKLSSTEEGALTSLTFRFVACLFFDFFYK